MKIFIAAGHGGKDPGAVANGVVERDEAIKIVNDAAEYLARIIQPPYELIIVPHELSLVDTVVYINENTKEVGRDICIELHLNANEGTPGTGTETYYGYKRLAEILQKGIVGVLKLKDRGVKEDNFFYFNKATRTGSALVEIGFINNMTDLQEIRKLGAFALAKGISDFLGLKLPSTPTPPPPEPDWKAKYLALKTAVLLQREAIKRNLDNFKIEEL